LGDNEGAVSSGNIAVFEAKRDGKNQTDLDMQTRKNLRLKSLICAHCGLNIKGKEPLILDIRGCKAIVYTIKKFEGFFGAGRVAKDPLELPVSAPRMKAFLESGGLGALCRIAVSVTKSSLFCCLWTCISRILEECCYWLID
jgi:hypothetical protein